MTFRAASDAPATTEQPHTAEGPAARGRWYEHRSLRIPGIGGVVAEWWPKAEGPFFDCWSDGRGDLELRAGRLHILLQRPWSFLSADERGAYIAATCPTPQRLGVSVTLPLIGGAFFDWNFYRQSAAVTWRDFFSLDLQRAGSIEIGCGRATIQADLSEPAYHWPRAARLAASVPWFLLGLPLLIAIVLFVALLTALTNPFRWRLKRLALRLAWKIRPEQLDTKARAWATKASDHEEMVRLYVAREAERMVAEEAALEAEVERRLAERLAAAGA
ncbi:hypothetical protein [Ancylobacter sp.]|uniref:hypothetical protein n=1 Tax=Ancylobacter sp. TaxID=1872567 RepID=UPI003D0C1753